MGIILRPVDISVKYGSAEINDLTGILSYMFLFVHTQDPEAVPGRTLPTLQRSHAEQTRILSPQPEPDKHHCECSEDIQPFVRVLFIILFLKNNYKKNK